MGWSAANEIFNPVARSLQEAGLSDEKRRGVLGDLIGRLQDGDWDTEDESLEDFLDDPAIVSAFADHKVHLSDRRCCAREIGADPRQVIIGMRDTEYISEQAITEALDAYAHQLADRLRDDARRTDSNGERQLAIYGRELADLIDPAVKR